MLVPWCNYTMRMKLFFTNKHRKVVLDGKPFNRVVQYILPYSGLFLRVEIFVKSLIRPPELNMARNDALASGHTVINAKIINSLSNYM